jgi:hypothetical protein
VARMKASRADSRGRETTEKPRRRKLQRSATPSGRTDGNGFRAKIRMYRQGLGDCFLITLPRKNDPSGSNPYRIMVDCGVILGTENAVDKMTKVVEDIVRETKGHVDLLLATHVHWDHLSGFTQAEEAFKDFKADQVWMPWTEDPQDPNGRALRNERDSALSALRMNVARMHLAGDTETASEVSGLIDFFGMAATSTPDALNKARKLGPVRYCRPTDAPIVEPDTGVRFYVMGPPLDEKFLKRTNPSSAHPETYGMALDVFAANTPPLMGSGKTDSPFGTLFAIPMPVAQGMEFFRQRYWTAEVTDLWRNIDTASFADTSALALQLDRVTNNTSLVLAIELSDGDVLLFAADAQVGNWLSWGTLKWNVAGVERDGPGLLKRTVFYKVGHHASNNATLRKAGLELMEKLQFAMIPVDEGMARRKDWNHMPLPALEEALRQQAKIVVRADKPAPASTVVSGPDDLFYEIRL